MTADDSKTVFISYRRDVSKYLALLLFKDLIARGYDVFWDIDSIGAGQFEKIILSQIRARAHFIVLLANGTLERCHEPNDWLRREIEYAIEHKRNVIPVMVDDFKFDSVQKYLTNTLAKLPDYNAAPLFFQYFDAGVDRLCSQFLVATDYGETVATPEETVEEVEEIIEKASTASEPTEEQLNTEQVLRRAFSKYRDGDWDGAIVDFTSVITLDPKNDTAYHYRARSYHELDNLDAALRDFDQAIKLKPDLAEAYGNRGNARSDKGDIEGAIADYTQAIKLKPADAGTYYHRGYAYYADGNITAAIKDFTRAISIAPKEATAHNNRGYLYFELGKYQKALTDYKRANTLDPDMNFAIGGLAITHHALGRVNRAKEYWQQLMKLDERYKDLDWVAQELNWSQVHIEEARKLIAKL